MYEFDYKKKKKENLLTICMIWSFHRTYFYKKFLFWSILLG